jgi:hypothetical protein
VYADNGTYTITISLKDDDGATANGIFHVVVGNAPPVVNTDVAVEPITEGGTLTLPSTPFTDPGTLDTHTATIDWGDGSAAQAAAVTETTSGPPGSTDGMSGTVASSSHKFLQNGTYTVSVNVKDKDGAVGVGTYEVTVLDAAPTVQKVDDQTVNEGQTLTIGTTFADAGVQDTESVSIDWGDGKTGVGTITQSNGSGSMTGSHVFADNGDFKVTIKVTDDAGMFTTEQFTAHVLNVAPTLTISGAANASQDQPYTLGLASSDPGADTITNWSINWGDGNVQSVVGNPSSVDHTFTAGGATYAISATATDEDGTWGPSNTLSVAVDHGYLGVETLTSTATGFHVEFNRAFDASKVNLYGSQTVGEGPADVTLAGAQIGAVTGSLVVDADDKGFTFIRTGGALTADTYTVTLASRTNGFVDMLGRTLDGNDNDINGDDYNGSFVIAGSTAPRLSISDFSRGPGQVVNIPANGAGLPITISNGAGVSSISFQLHYNPSLLDVTDVTLASGLGAGATLTKDLSVPGVVKVSISGISGLSATSHALVSLQAKVPNNAPYTSKQILDISGITVNGAAGGIDDDGLQVVGYIGDAAGNAAYETLDIQRIQRVIAKADTGFSAYRDVDPVIVADIAPDGVLNTLDITFLQRQIAGLAPVQIPAIPAGIGPIVRGGPDPLVSVARDFKAAPGQIVTVPINLDTAAGLDGAQLRLGYDSSSLEVVAVRRGTLTGDFDYLVQRDEPGLLSVDMAGMNALSGGAGSLIEIDFRVKAGAAAGVRLLDLQWAELNDGDLTLTPAPQVGLDATDGLLTITAAASAPGGTGTGAAMYAQTVRPQAAPAFEIAPVIDWGARIPNGLVVPKVDLGVGESTQPKWTQDFVTGLGESDSERNPNSKIRVTVPVGHTKVKLAHNPVISTGREST